MSGRARVPGVLYCRLCEKNVNERDAKKAANGRLLCPYDLRFLRVTVKTQKKHGDSRVRA